MIRRVIGKVNTMLFQDENILIYHPGKCGGTTVEHLFLRSLRNCNLVQLLQQPCFSSENNRHLTPEFLNQRISFMTGFIVKKYEINGISNIYLHHADVHSSIKIYNKKYIDSLFKITFVRNHFPRILSAFYYTMRDEKITFRKFVLNELEKIYKRNENYTVNLFGDLNKFTHYDGEQYVDFIGNLENIENDINELSSKLNISLDIKNERIHAKTISQAIYEHYSEAYDDEMVDVVYSLYQKDFELFNYRFERELKFNPKDLRLCPDGH